MNITYGKDKNTGRRLGFCIIEFDSEEAATAALSQNGYFLNGKEIRVQNMLLRHELKSSKSKGSRNSHSRNSLEGGSLKKFSKKSAVTSEGKTKCNSSKTTTLGAPRVSDEGKPKSCRISGNSPILSITEEDANEFQIMVQRDDASRHLSNPDGQNYQRMDSIKKAKSGQNPSVNYYEKYQRKNTAGFSSSSVRGGGFMRMDSLTGRPEPQYLNKNYDQNADFYRANTLHEKNPIQTQQRSQNPNKEFGIHRSNTDISNSDYLQIPTKNQHSQEEEWKQQFNQRGNPSQNSIYQGQRPQIQVLPPSYNNFNQSQVYPQNMNQFCYPGQQAPAPYPRRSSKSSISSKSQSEWASFISMGIPPCLP